MSVVNFEQHQCNKIRSYLDSYLNDELLVETNHEVLKHLQSCKGCAQALEDRARVKTLLQRAVRRDEAPAALRERIERDVRKNASASWSFNAGARWALAAAAMIAVIIGSWAAVHSLVSRKAGSPEASLEQTARVLNIGLSDHINCAIVHEQANRRFTPEQMAEKMGADYVGLVPIVKEKAPAGYEVVVAHKCHVNKREFIHMILKNHENVLSLIITKKNGEAFPQIAGTPLYEARMQDYEAAGFETRDYLGFVVSNLSKDDNLQIASTLTPVVRDFLSKMEA
ncbi:MAG TPA: zf-HC2 domain-containing protein [Blastocatellia bacterium]|nr:zf-HC2 domain-containing protein [Blastocatellia bacterium]